MITIHPDDFDRTDGRNKIIVFMHQLEVKIHELEREIKELKKLEKREEKDIEDMWKERS